MATKSGNRDFVDPVLAMSTLEALTLIRKDEMQDIGQRLMTQERNAAAISRRKRFKVVSDRAAA